MVSQRNILSVSQITRFALVLAIGIAAAATARAEEEATYAPARGLHPRRLPPLLGSNSGCRSRQILHDRQQVQIERRLPRHLPEGNRSPLSVAAARLRREMNAHVLAVSL